VKVLIVTMFFPPTGGGSVQRPLKFATHLAALGFETFVVAPDDSKWIERDESLTCPARVEVIRVRNPSPSMAPLGPALYRRHGLERLALHARLGLRRVLVPDSSVPWLTTAVPAVVRIVREAGIDVVLTTSPPTSVNLIGALAKRLTGVRWVADIRDSIAFHPHRRRAIRGETTVARLVARYADAVAAASQTIADQLVHLEQRCNVQVVESGCDFDDFDGLAYRRSGRFRIAHTGNFVGPRDPRPFLQALAHSNEDVVARFMGTFRDRDRDYASRLELGERLELIPFGSRRDALALQRDTEALLLIVPEAEGRGASVVTGKVFEYLAAARPILAAVPPQGDAAKLINRVGAGIVVAPNDVDGLASAIRTLHGRWRTGTLNDVALSPEVREGLSRRASVERLAQILLEAS
jgi:glycosyltransferase involved in cell wall biosynthesis